MKTALAPRDLLLTLAIVTLWGFSFVPIKVGLRELPPFALAALRFFFAAVPLVFVIRRPRMPWRDVVGYGVAIGVFQFGLLFLGMQARHARRAVVAGDPGAGVLHHRSRHRLSRRPLATAQSASARASPPPASRFSPLQSLIEGAHATLVGFALVIVAAFAWGVGNVIAKRAAAEHEADMFGLIVWSSLVPPLPLALLSYVFEGGASAWGAVASAGMLTWGCVLFLAWGATLFGFASWARLLHRYPTGLIAPFALLIPVSGHRLRRDFSWRVAGAACRRSACALVFAGLVGECLRSAHPDVAVSRPVKSRRARPTREIR